MQEIDPRKIGIAVIASYPKWYRGKLRSIKHTDKVRGDLAMEFAQIASRAGYKLVVADSKSPKTFLREIGNIPGLHLIRRKKLGRGEGKRFALDKVSKLAGVEIIILTEAEKISLLTDCMALIAEPFLTAGADIVVPSRENRLFKSTYPDYMYESESEGNQIYEEALRANNIIPQNAKALDLLFGPRALRNNKKIISLFKRKYEFKGLSLLDKQFDPDEFSNVLYFPLINAYKQKHKVISIEVPFEYPKTQKDNEDLGARQYFIHKRNLQRIGLLVDLMHFLSYLNKNKNSGIINVK